MSGAKIIKVISEAVAMAKIDALTAELTATREALSVCEQERDVDRVKYREALEKIAADFDPLMDSWRSVAVEQRDIARRALGGSDADV